MITLTNLAFLVIKCRHFNALFDDNNETIVSNLVISISMHHVAKASEVFSIMVLYQEARKTQVDTQFCSLFTNTEQTVWVVKFRLQIDSFLHCFGIQEGLLESNDGRRLPTDPSPTAAFQVTWVSFLRPQSSSSNTQVCQLNLRSPDLSSRLRSEPSHGRPLWSIWVRGKWPWGKEGASQVQVPCCELGLNLHFVLIVFPSASMVFPSKFSFWCKIGYFGLLDIMGGTILSNPKIFRSSVYQHLTHCQLPPGCAFSGVLAWQHISFMWDTASKTKQNKKSNIVKSFLCLHWPPLIPFFCWFE